MQLITLYNATTKSQHFPGITTLAAGTARDVAIPQVDFDPYFRPLLEKGSLVGVGAYSPDGSALAVVGMGLFAVASQRRTATGAMNTTARTQICVTTSGAYNVELPLASAVPAGEVIYVFNDARSGANTLSVIVADGSGDTIDGEEDPIALTAVLNTRRFVSNGTDGWTTY